MSLALDVRHTDEMAAGELAELRDMLVDCFSPRYDESAWAHCLGGTHYLLRHRGQLVSHGALIPRHFEQAGRELRGLYGESMATVPNLRGRGLGSIVLAAATADILMHHEIGVFAASKYHFYERLGWLKWPGETYVVAADGRRPAAPARGAVMYRLPPGSTIDPAGDLAADWRAGDIW
ncbi:GNAT family N-acetyltransferase [Streptomyces sp. NPDC091371]|uniref:GNAT family N-acetyltransferase n=1 Tax=Streptomyces sp. NPDC091371 TaxID=3155303 RepID=UPI00343B186A